MIIKGEILPIAAPVSQTFYSAPALQKLSFRQQTSYLIIFVKQ
jgi:hypothetical protein